MCIWSERSERRLGLGCGAREAWEGIPRALQPNTNLLSPQRHVNSDRERVSLSLSPGLSATKRRYWTPGSFPATCFWPWCPRKMGRELGTTHYRIGLVISTWKILLLIMNTFFSDCHEQLHRNQSDRWRSTFTIGAAQLFSDPFNMRLINHSS